MMGGYGLMRHYGLIASLLSKLSTGFTNSPRNTELTLFAIGSVLSLILIGLVTRLTVIAGPVFNELGQKQNLHPSRRANLLDAIANGLSYIIPWHVWPLLMLLTITPLQKNNAAIAIPTSIDLVTMAFYPIVIWLILLFAILTGFGRSFEIPDQPEIASTN